MSFAIEPPIEPMLAKLAEAIPVGPFLYEPKWDGFRAIVFRGGSEVFIQSRDLRPLDRYFPELHDALLERLPDGSVIDGEIVIATPRGLDFEALQLRLHPAASRAAKLAKATPASFVAFDALALDGGISVPSRRASGAPCSSRRSPPSSAPVHLTPMTRDPQVATDWLSRFEGAGLDGVIAKPQDEHLRAGQARDDQDQARADRRLCGRRVSLAQGRAGRARSARCCWDSTTRRARSITSA